MMNTPLQLDRRTILRYMACLSGAAALRGQAGLAGTATKLPPWTPGHFDIHHIDTGRGNSTLLIFPDGTTMMIDAGAVITAPAGTLARARPNDSRRPGEWLGRYALAHASKPKIDYFLATHIHNDHVDGIADVDALMPISTFIDRGFPRYAVNQQPSSAAYAQNYLHYLKTCKDQGRRVESAQVGSTSQIVPLSHTPTFAVRILAANGNVWNPQTNAVDAHLAELPAATDAHGNENLFSVATRFTYGRFSYFTGGDLTFDTEDGRQPAFDIETPVARAAGRTEVAVADHHGYFDACGPAFTNTLDAQAYIIPSWDIGHPGSAQMQRMLGAWNSTGSKATHDVFALELPQSNALLNRRFASLLRSQQGHVVVRVAPGGDTYEIFTVDSATEIGNITGTFGAYTCRA